MSSWWSESQSEHGSSELTQSGPSELPQGWAWTTFDEVCDVNPGVARPHHFTDETQVSFVPMAAVDDVQGTIVSHQTRSVGEGWKGYTRFVEGDVILAKITPCMENGKCAIAAGLRNGVALGSTEFHVLRASGAVLPQWVYHFVRQESFRRSARAEMTGTAGQLRVPASFVRQAALPLASLPAQERIVAEIETQFTRLDTAVAALKRVQARLRRFKTSVLRAACEGRLVPTEAELARAEGRDYEPAAVLLQRILAERRAKWEAEHPGKRYQEPEPSDTSELPELPEGWCAGTVSSVAQVRLGRQRSPARATGPNMRRYLRAANVTWDGLDLSDVKEMDFSPAELGTYRLRCGDILLSEASGSVSEVGKPALWNEQIPDCCFQNTLIRVRSEGPLSAYLLLHFQYDARAQRFSRVARGVGIHHLGAEGLSQWVVSVPPLAEQHRVVTEAERRLSAAQELERQVDLALHCAERLRQSILKSAFEGRLVPQDPNDEPASVLLERIQAARTNRRGEASRATHSANRRAAAGGRAASAKAADGDASPLQRTLPGIQDSQGLMDDR